MPLKLFFLRISENPKNFAGPKFRATYWANAVFHLLQNNFFRRRFDAKEVLGSLLPFGAFLTTPRISAKYPIFAC